MRIGPEQLDRYLEIARKAMDAAIVDPGEPKVYKVRREWKNSGIDRGTGTDEITVWGGRRGSASNGVGLRDFPKNGEYRIRMQASAILPEGFDAVPLNLDMGAPARRVRSRRSRRST